MGEIAILNERHAFFTVGSLAEYLSTTERNVEKWVEGGLLASYKILGIRRFDPADVHSFLDKYREEAA